MISTFTHTIISLGIGGAKPTDRLQFLKYNTLGSIHGLYAKVIFLVFKNNESVPFLCIKTVRKAEDNFLIENSHTHLSSLNVALEGTTLSMIFPQALYLGTYSGINYSIETGLSGRRAVHTDLGKIVRAYSEFQVQVGSIASSVRTFDQTIKDITTTFEVDDAREFVAYATTLDGFTEEVTHINQHGDMTFDNMFVNRNGMINVIDCEEYGTYTVAGFDLYHLLSRIGYSSYSSQKPFLDSYFKTIGVLPVTPARFFLLYITDLIRKYPLNVGRVTSADTIARFKNLLV